MLKIRKIYLSIYFLFSKINFYFSFTKIFILIQNVRLYQNSDFVFKIGLFSKICIFFSKILIFF